MPWMSEKSRGYITGWEKALPKSRTSKKRANMKVERHIWNLAKIMGL